MSDSDEKFVESMKVMAERVADFVSKDAKWIPVSFSFRDVYRLATIADRALKNQPPKSRLK